MYLTHGHTHKGHHSKTYRAWGNMKDRCLNANSQSYKDYGGRGITVCQRWLEGFENFLEDMGIAPTGLQLDRINNNLGYCKENCKWSSRKEQQRNRNCNRIITINGITKLVIDWAIEYHVSPKSVMTRIHRKFTSEER